MGWRILVNSLDRIEQELELGVAIVAIAPGMHAITGAKMFLSVTAKWLNVVNKAPVGSLRLGKQCVMHHFVYSPQCLGGQVADTIILPHSFCLVVQDLHLQLAQPETKDFYPPAQHHLRCDKTSRVCALILFDSQFPTDEQGASLCPPSFFHWQRKVFHSPIVRESYLQQKSETKKAKPRLPMATSS